MLPSYAHTERLRVLFIPSTLLVNFILIRYLSRLLRNDPWYGRLLSILSCAILTTALIRLFYQRIGIASRHAIFQYFELFWYARDRHNQAVIDYNCEGMISGEEDNRVLRIRKHTGEVFIYPFDRWRRERQEAISGFVTKLLLGPENVRRICTLNEKLDALDRQLHPIRNIKGGGC